MEFPSLGVSSRTLDISRNYTRTAVEIIAIATNQLNMIVGCIGK